MYKINKIRCSGDDWYEVLIDGPNRCSIPMRQFKPNSGVEEIRQRAEAWCDKQNKINGWVGTKAELYRQTGRNWTTIRYERKRKQ